MGVDVKAVYSIIHYGPPKSISEYVQESGRAGRDGISSSSVLIHYPGSTGKAKCDKEMKDFLKEESSCRRELVLKHFASRKGEWTLPKHKCCDKCTCNCKCDGDSCMEDKTLCEISLAPKGELPPSHNVLKRIVSDKDRHDLTERLYTYREACLLEDDESSASSHLYSGKDIASGLPSQTI